MLNPRCERCWVQTGATRADFSSALIASKAAAVGLWREMSQNPRRVRGAFASIEETLQRQPSLRSVLARPGPCQSAPATTRLIPPNRLA
jgi:hypothetical protein